MPIPYWAGHYIGLPFKERGRDMTGLDCWGLVRLVLHEQLDIQVPSYAHYYVSSTSEKQIGPLVRRESLNWKRVAVENSACGDVLILRMRGQPMHAALVLDHQYMLHIERGINSVLERYDSMRWRNRIVGVFRHQEMNDE